ncbi:MAG TPA: Gfo/Idh/MocA family oxidoreductase [Thermoguttaceae bacterium]|nr:Gfo/Idh/MocA family oxidoreductase [Thermoguttaceae bacterium]
MRNRPTNRRHFIKTAAAALAVPSWIPATVLAAPGRPGANDRICVGLIGAGHRSKDLTRESAPDLKLVAVADCDLRAIADFLATFRQLQGSIVAEKCSPYQDYRQMLSKEKLDGVFVATTTHARVLACIHAMQAGLDVYAEKPLTLTIEEGQRLVRAEQAYRTVFQVGTQQRSIAINNFGSDLIRNGAIGKVLTVTCPNFPGPRPRPQLPTEPTPAEMDWDLWCNQTALTPFSPELHPGLGRWARYREYCGWLVTGWVHAFDQIQRALGTDETGPVEVWPEEPGPDGRVTLRYARGTLLKLDMPEDKGPRMGGIFVGEKGKIEINRNRLAANPPELIENAPPAADKSEYASVSHEHIRNWVHCMRTREKPVASAAIGHRSTTVCHLVNICRELGRKLHWDPVKEEFVGDEEANALRTRPRRKGYELPPV